jgi:hypothetical protein
MNPWENLVEDADKAAASLLTFIGIWGALFILIEFYAYPIGIASIALILFYQFVVVYVRLSSVSKSTIKIFEHFSGRQLKWAENILYYFLIGVVSAICLSIRDLIGRAELVGP